MADEVKTAATAVVTDVKAEVSSAVKADEAKALTFLQANAGKVVIAVAVVAGLVGHFL